VILEIPEAKLQLMQIDLGDIDSVKEFAAQFRKKHQQLDVLINNAGMTNMKREETKQGFEAHWGTNHLGPFVLTASLLSVLQNTPKARIVTVASFVPKLMRATLDWEDLLYLKKKYDAMGAYGQSKLANIMFALELNNKLKAHHSEVISVLASPGYTKSGIQQSQSTWIQLMTLFLGQSVDMGMLPSLRAAVDPDVKGGEFYSPLRWKEMRGYPELTTVPDAALNVSETQKLWNMSEQMTHTAFKFV
jgi:NAD(P)-dependent dehydrogenase (short-subunit alcohol dehydrogenase family)